MPQEDGVKKPPDPIDRHVGARIRMLRLRAGLTLTELGAACSITYQQVQKYEVGTNRVSASRLCQIGVVFGVLPEFFFEGAPDSPVLELSRENSAEMAAVKRFATTFDGIRLGRYFSAIRNDLMRRRIIELVEALAEEKSPSTFD